MIKSTLTALIGALLILSAPPSRAADIDPEAVKLGQSILEITHADAMGNQVAKLMIQAFTNGLNQANPGKNDQVSKLLDEIVLPILQTEMLPRMFAEMPKIYALNFSADELRQLLAFYQSDIGRKFIEKQPELLKESNAVGQAIAKSVSPEIIGKLQEAIQARGLKMPQSL